VAVVDELPWTRMLRVIEPKMEQSAWAWISPFTPSGSGEEYVKVEGEGWLVYVVLLITAPPPVIRTRRM
jgi:hypothetical protein